MSTTTALLGAYVVCLKVAQVSDDSNPDQERRGPEENAAQIVIGEVLREEKNARVGKQPGPLGLFTSLSWVRTDCPTHICHPGTWDAETGESP